MSFLVKYGRYSVAKFFNSSEVRRAINSILPSTGGKGGSGVSQVYAHSPVYISGSIAQPVVNIDPAFTVTTESQNFKGVKTFIDTPLTATPAIGFQDGNQIVNKNYIDTVAAGLKMVASVRAASYPGFGSGLELVAGSILDDVTLAENDRVLLKDEPFSKDNGIYVIHISTAPTRATDYNDDLKVGNGTFTTVLEGTTNVNSQWAQYMDHVELGVDPLMFSKLGIASSVISVNGQTGTVAITNYDIGLGNVDNTSDLDKPVSTATQEQLDKKLDITSINDSGVGALTTLINPAVDLPPLVVMATDANGKVWYSLIKNTQLNTLTGINEATTVQTQLNLKATVASPNFTGSPTAPTKAALDNSTNLATTAYVDRKSRIVVQKSNTSATGSTTYQDVADLNSISLEAASTYHFVIRCPIATALATTGINISLRAHSGTSSYLLFARKTSTNATGAFVIENVTGFESGSTPAAGPGPGVGGNAAGECVIEGVITTSTAMVVGLVYKSEINASNVTILRGAVAMFEKTGV